MASLEQLESGLGPIRIGLRKDLVFSRHLLRGEPRYVVHDPVTFKNVAFSPIEYEIMTAMVPRRSLAEAFDHLVLRGTLSQTSSDKKEFYSFVLHLHGLSLLHLPITNAQILYERYSKRKAAQKPSLLRAIIYYKIPLIDPDQFLDKTVGYAGLLFSRIGVAFWACLMLFSAWKCWGRFGEMFAESSHLLQLSNIPVLYVALVLLKILHEFGHAYACKRIGGEVPEMGVVFILAAPCAYVDASASWKFSGRWNRISVALGGMYVESIVAAFFALVWAGTQPGFTHDVAVNVLTLASVVTIFFNINPLMRFDGYYIFSDLVGAPNLWERSSRFIREKLKKICLGLAPTQQHLNRRERMLYSAYGVSAVVYKFFLALGIVTMVLMNWPLAGAVLGVAFGFMMLVQPVLTLVRYLFTAEETEPVRRRAQTVAYLAVILVPLLVFLTPVSWSVVAPGTLEPQNYHVIRAPADGFIVDLSVDEGDKVRKGQSLVSLDSTELELELIKAQKELEAETTRLEVAELVDSIQASVHRVQLDFLEERLAWLRARQASMQVLAPRAGSVVSRSGPPGTFVKKGEELLVIHSGRAYLRVVLTDEEVARTRIKEGSELDLRWSAQPGVTVPAVVKRILPSASRSEVPKELTVLAGGEIYGTATREDELLADQPYLHVVLEPSNIPLQRSAGLTAKVRFPAEVRTLGEWFHRKLTHFYNAWRMS